MREQMIHCRICGQPIAKNSGQQSPHPEFGENVSARLHYEGTLKTLPPEFGEWCWTCDACVVDLKSGQINAAALKSLIDADEPEDVATRIVYALVKRDWNTGISTGHITAESMSKIGASRWGHVPQSVRDELQMIYAAEKMRDEMTDCTWGACYWCGVRSAKSWVESPFRWRDGSRAPLCAECNAVFEKRGSPTATDARAIALGESMHVAASEAATGYNVGLGRSVSGEFRVYGETKTCDKIGTYEPWTYNDKIIQYREAVWVSHPRYAPIERRDEFEKRHAIALEAARRVETLKREQAVASRW